MSDRIRIVKEKVLTDNWFKVKEVTFDYTWFNGKVQRQSREVCKKGDYSGILLYNVERKSIILTRQFRMPAFMNNQEDGFLIETAAGMLDEDDPAECAKREVEEETGFKVKNLQKAFEAYTSPGTLSELAHLYVAEYHEDLKVSEGGGTDQDEDIEVLELSFEEALNRMNKGEIKDAKTIMLLQYAQIHKLLEN